MAPIKESFQATYDKMSRVGFVPNILTGLAVGIIVAVLFLAFIETGTDNSDSLSRIIIFALSIPASIALVCFVFVKRIGKAYQASELIYIIAAMIQIVPIVLIVSIGIATFTSPVIIVILYALAVVTLPVLTSKLMRSKGELITVDEQEDGESASG